MAEQPTQHADYEQILDAPFDPQAEPWDVRTWARHFDWAYCTVDECYGQEPRQDRPPRWCVYDAGEDDPPIYECDFEEEARYLVEALRLVAGLHIDGDER